MTTKEPAKLPQTTFVTVNVDDVTLRAESDDPGMPAYLLALAVASNEALQRNRDALAEINEQIFSYGRTSYLTAPDGTITVLPLCEASFGPYPKAS